MSVEWGAGLHVSAGGKLDASAYWHYVGRWSHLVVPALLDAAEVRPGQLVLDVATGSGEAASLAVSAVGESGLVIGADISLAMLHAARERLPGSTFRAVRTDAASLAFRDFAFDAAICQLGLMFFPDRLRALVEMRRVLHHGARASVCVLCSADCAPMWGVLADCLVRYLPEEKRVLQLSFSLGDATELEALLCDAGFDDVLVRRETREGVIASFDDYWAPIESGAGQLPQAYLALPEVNRRIIRREVRERLSHFEIDGRLVMSVQMLIGTGRA